MTDQIRDFYAGDTSVWKFQFTTAQTPTPTPIDITGWQLRLIMKPKTTDPDTEAVVNLTLNVGDNPTDDPTNGVAFFTLTSTASGAIPPGSYVYAFQRIIPGSPPDVRTLIQSKVKVLDSVKDVAP